MPIELVSMETATPFDRLRLVIVGKEKTGKSKLSATARKSVLNLDWDARREAIAGMKGVYAATLIDPQDTFKQPTAFNDGLDLLAKLEEKRSLTHLGFKGVPAEKDFIQTAVIDSVASMANAAKRYALYTTKDIRRVINIGGKMQVMMPNGWDGWNAEMGMVESYVGRLLAIKGLDVILVFHEDAEEAADSTSEKRKFTGRVDVWPARYSNLLKYFNEVWRVTRTDGSEPKIQVIPDYQFQAATNLGIANPKANIEEMINEAIKRGFSQEKVATPQEQPGAVQPAKPVGIAGVVRDSQVVQANAGQEQGKESSPQSQAAPEREQSQAEQPAQPRTILKRPPIVGVSR